MNLTTLKDLVPYFHIVTYYPIFLLDHDLFIKESSPYFFKVPKDYFQGIVKRKIQLPHKSITIFQETQCYILFPYACEDIKAILIGPLLYHKPYYKEDIYNNQFLKDIGIQSELEGAIVNIPHITYRLYPFLQMFYRLLFDEQLDTKDIFASIQKDREDISTSLEVTSAKVQGKEFDQVYYPYELEKQLLHYVKKAESTRARTVANDIFKRTRLFIPYQDNLELQRLYTVQLLALLRTTAMEAHVDIESSFHLNQIYLTKLSAAWRSEELYETCMAMIVDFSTLIKKRSYAQYPSWIRHSINYIFDHLHSAITLQEIADHVHMSATYISVQFKKQMELSLMDFIARQKVEEAKYLLEFSEMSLTDISLTLGYSSPSYFTRSFKKVMMISPLEYRKHH